MVDQIITRQDLIDAHVDAQALEDIVNDGPEIQVQTRLGRFVWTLATLEQRSLLKIQEWQNAIDSIVIDSGVPDSVVVNKNRETQEKINSQGGATWYSKSGGYNLNDRVILDNGDIVRSTVANNTNDPNADMAGWELAPKRSEIEKLDTATNFYVTPQMFSPKGIDIGDGVTDAYPYIKQALDSGYPVKIPFPSVKYRVTQNIVFNGHSVEGMAAAPELFGSTGKAKVIIEFDGVLGVAVKNISTKSNISNIWFRQKDWSTELDGLFLDRYSIFDSCLFTHFNGHGFYAFTDGIGGSGLAGYHSVFKSCGFEYNKKHGVGLYNGANAIYLEYCLARWNGSPSYDVQPSTAGIYDGLYVDGNNASYPPSYALEPQGCVVIGGDFSYNSRYGQNWHKAGQNVLVGGYLEFNKVNDLRIGTVFGMQVCNPICVSVAPTLDVVQVDPTEPTNTLFNYPNQIVVNGTDYGNGLKYAPASTQRGANSVKILPTFRTSSAVTSAYVFAKTSGGIKVDSATLGNDFELSDNVPLCSNSTRFGAYAKANVSSSTVRPIFSSATGVEGETITSFISAGTWSVFKTAAGGGMNAADCFMSAAKNSVTNRSINAAGTINASGADYAEYMQKSEGCGDIRKGEIVGVNKDGKLTKKFDESISFVVKSTDPSIVGGDTWFIEEPPKEPVPEFININEDASDEDQREHHILSDELRIKFESDMRDYERSKFDFDQRLDAARRLVDRIAFCGQVPIIYAADAGDYIIPVRNIDGTIGVESTKKPTFEQHLKCVGKVWKVIHGTAHIVIFNN